VCWTAEWQQSVLSSNHDLAGRRTAQAAAYEKDIFGLQELRESFLQLMDLILDASRGTGWPGMTGAPLPMLAITDATMASTGRGTSTENATETEPISLKFWWHRRNRLAHPGRWAVGNR
jgi:hypothetical protein